MIIKHARDVPQVPVTMEGAEGCTVRWLVGKSDQAPSFAMRQFEVAPGGYTPRHFHDYEHEVFVLEGEGVVVEGDSQHPLKTGDVVLVIPNEVHQFRNTGSTPLKFLCLVPNSSYNLPVSMAAECADR
jgi:quercetin dioxygenase-like cupin family protein